MSQREEQRPQTPQGEQMVVSLSNQKGGVGKTLSTIHVGGALNELGYDVLLVDCDPQGHLSEAVGFGEAYDYDALNLHHVLVDQEHQSDLGETIVEHEEFDVVPANVDMLTLEEDLMNTRRREERLRLAVDELDRAYDFVLLDAPPNLGVVTDNVLLAGSRILIPAEAQKTSIRALELLYDEIDALSEAFQTSIEPVGLIANNIQQDSENEEMLEWFEDTFADMHPVFRIRKRVALQRALNAGVSIFQHDEDCDMADEYRRIAEQLEEVRER